jgi:hypothetical protein
MFTFIMGLVFAALAGITTVYLWKDFVKQYKEAPDSFAKEKIFLDRVSGIGMVLAPVLAIWALFATLS